MGLLLTFFLWQTRNLPEFSSDNDEGVYLLTARMLTSGHQLYTDIFFVHPPLFVYLVAAAFVLTETSVAVGQIVAIACATVGLLAVALATRELSGETSSIIAVVLLGIAPRFYHYSRAILLDLPCVSLATLAIAFSLYYLRSGKPRWLMFTGLALTASYLTKLLLLPTIFPIFLSSFLYARSRTFQTQWYTKLLGDIFLLAVSIALPLALCFFVFDPQAMYNNLVDFHLQRIKTYDVDIISNGWKILTYLRSNYGLSILAVWGSLRLLKKRSSNALVVLTWLLAITATLLRLSPLYLHYLDTLLFPMAILGGTAFGDWFESLQSISRHRTASLLPLFLGSCALAAFLFSLPEIVRENREPLPTHREKEEADAMHFLTKVTLPGDFIITDNQFVAFLTDREVPPNLVDTSWMRLRTGQLTSDELIATMRKYQPQAVVFMTERIRSMRPEYAKRVESNYLLRRSWDITYQIWYVKRVESPSQIEHPRLVRLGDQISLLGYNINGSPVKADQVLRLTLYWKAAEKVENNYTVFTHLLNNDGLSVGQKDNPPVNGFYPTSTWKKDEIITDRYAIPLAADLPSGQYQIEIGMYDFDTGVRLPAFDEKGHSLGDSILLGNVEIIH